MHQFQRGVGVQCAKDAGARRGAVLQITHKIAIARTGVVGIGVMCFLGVGVLLQPVQQLQVHGRAAIAVLRRVQMQVHQARRDDLPAVVVYRHTGGDRFRKRPAAAILTQHIPVPHPQRARGRGIHKNALYGKTFHIYPPVGLFHNGVGSISEQRRGGFYIRPCNFAFCTNCRGEHCPPLQNSTRNIRASIITARHTPLQVFYLLLLPKAV